MKTVKKINLEMNEAEAELMIEALKNAIECEDVLGSPEVLRRLTILKARILSEME